jgi:predicted extracellular nuclease
VGVARLRLGTCLVLALVFVLAGSVQQAGAASTTVVISQIYGGGGNSGAQYTHDFIEIFNRSQALIDMTGMSVQYGSTTGNIGPTASQITPLSGFLAPGQYLLVQEAQGAGGTTPLSPDITDPTPIAMSATGGKVALVSSTAGLNCGASATPCSAAALAQVVDLVGYDGSNMAEGSPTPALTNTTAALRNGDGCTDTDNNASDFSIGAPNPRNRLSPTFDCQGDVAPSVASTTPANGAADVATDANVSITFSEPVNVSGTWYSISCGTSGSHTAAASGGPTTFTLDPDSDFAQGETCTATVFAANVSDRDANDPPDNMTGDDSWSFTTVAPAVAIHDIQGAAHTSPLNGQNVSGVVGIVTAKRSNGFYMQDPSPDADAATSEAIFVFTSSPPAAVNVGDAVRVGGRVTEFRPGGSSSTNLSTTEIGSSPTVTVTSTGNSLPATTVIGSGGRIPPGQVIEDDAAGSVETSGAFDPASDGIDFYESLEAMRVQVNNPVTVGPTNGFGEVTVVGDDGANAAVRTGRGGIVIRPDDFNPERIQLDDAILPGSTPAANVGDHFSAPAVGVLDYDFGNFELDLTAPVTAVSGGLTREATSPQGAKEVAVATFNVENLDPGDGPAKFDTLAGLIVNNLKNPDIVALEEVQDNTGPVNDSTTDANLTLDTLVAAIQSAGGPAYQWRQINPVDDQDGGEPGGNIRVAFLFRTDRGVEFIDRPGGDSTTPTTVLANPSGPELSFSPGRVAPTNPAWNASRKPLAAQFKIRNRKFFMIANHFNSKGGDQPLFGRFQPPTRSSEVQRHQQARLVNDFVDSILALDGNANIVVLGDINDFQFSETVNLLEGGVLHDLVDTLPVAEQYSYDFEGNSQVLDHILVSNNAFGLPFVFDAVHANAEFADQASDHDPNIVRFALNSPPKANAGTP